jgi:hypothetical protein
MFLQLIANGRGTANVRLDGGHAGRRGRDVVAQNPFVDKDATHHWRGAAAIRRDF